MRVNIIQLSLAAALCGIAAGQSWDSTGNGLLNGNYYFREVVWLVGDNSGNLSEATSFYGNISFDGNGNYTINNAQAFDSSNGAPASFSATGTYSISASGYGFLSSPVSTGDVIYGSVAQGIFTASTTETKAGFNDLFIAAKLASPNPTNSSFSGNYTMMSMDFIDGTPANTIDTQFQLNPDGNGNVGAVSVNGLSGGTGSSVITQNISGVKYFFSNGGCNINFTTTSSSTSISGTKYLYFSADGNFVFGGSPTGFDMVVGVRSASSTPSFGGLYYQAGVYQDESLLASTGVGDLNTYAGSLKPNAGALLADERLMSVFNNNAFDFTYSDSYTLNSDGTYNDANYHYVFGNGGALRIGVGTGPFIGINVAVQAPGFPPSGVYIDPTGIVNAASSAPFTAGVAPGEFISIYGTNLAPDTKADSSFPLEISGVQVLVNNNPVPVYVVSANQISALIPYAPLSSIAAIQVVNNGVASNTVTEFLRLTAPGVFTVPPGGLGHAAALHPDSSLITTDSPAQIGETVAIYISGLGTVSPPVADGTPGLANPLSMATNTIGVLFGGVSATVAYAGLAPGLVGLYQINALVPSGVTAGDNFVDISGPDFFTSQALLPIGSGSGAAAARDTPRRAIAPKPQRR
jgi:uncharacterized protein (TIGR03437 family)